MFYHDLNLSSVLMVTPVFAQSLQFPSAEGGFFAKLEYLCGVPFFSSAQAVECQLTL